MTIQTLVQAAHQQRRQAETDKQQATTLDAREAASFKMLQAVGILAFIEACDARERRQTARRRRAA